jgi:hypothetical protein
MRVTNQTFGVGHALSLGGNPRPGQVDDPSRHGRFESRSLDDTRTHSVVISEGIQCGTWTGTLLLAVSAVGRNDYRNTSRVFHPAFRNTGSLVFCTITRPLVYLDSHTRGGAPSNLVLLGLLGGMPSDHRRRIFGTPYLTTNLVPRLPLCDQVQGHPPTPFTRRLFVSF